ncbi:ectonucleoside triphosphate diphosphohydrolase 1-like isoform X2 [Ischnura elegans]|uniref:ectonucleoside triphosphate diphosphohydrolase 1-like isoform X2 n=1 Tax=Ischnura elegans TaxID=197161 RepID=UPI001ED8B154|nr:ectonucleoside triphosphate diphosphohydrolase 1-like isoform X2 [Ischnura elegans]
MSINVVIECSSSGQLGGYHEQRAYPTDTVGRLIDNYCAFKGIRREPAFVLLGKDKLLRESMKTIAEADIKDGDHLYLVKRGNPSELRLSRWWLLCGIALTIGIIGLATITILYVSTVYPPFDYGIIFDAGSTHTTMYLYKWQGDKANGTGVVMQEDSCPVDGGGIAADYRNSPKDVVPYLQKCLDKGVADIPEDRRSHSPVYLAATAGMRLLGAEDPEAEKEILGNITTLFKGTPLKFGGARTICGEEEALSGWVSVNYLSDTLTKARSLFRAKREEFSVKTIGAMDMGGASTQITFEMPPPANPSTDLPPCGDNIKTLKLFGKQYYLFSKSYLCFGVEEFLKMYYVLLLKDIPESNIDSTVTSVPSPCHNSGYSYTTTLKDLRSFCSNISLSSKFENRNITFSGAGKFLDCQNKVEALLNEDSCNKTFTSGNCLKQIPKRNYNATFSAFSSFGYMAEGLNITPSLGSDNFKNASKSVCEATWDQVKANTYPGILPKYKQGLCYQSVYQYLLLKNHYMLTESEWKKLNFNQTIDGTDVGWTLGFMINGTNVVPAEAPISSLLSLTGFIILGIFFASFVALAAAIASVALQKSRLVAAQPLHRSEGSADGSRQRTD